MLKSGQAYIKTWNVISSADNNVDELVHCGIASQKHFCVVNLVLVKDRPIMKL